MGLFAVTLGFISALCWGVADFFSAEASKKFGGVRAAFCSELVVAVIFSLIFVFVLRPEVKITGESLAYAIAGSIALGCGFAAFFKGLEIGPVSIVSPLGSIFPLVTTLILVLVFAAPLSLLHAVGIALVVVGATAASGMFNRQKGDRLIGVGPLFGLLAALCWGVGLALISRVVHVIGWEMATLMQFIVGPVVTAVLISLIYRHKRAFKGLNLKILTNKFVVGVSLVQIVAVGTMNFGLQIQPDLGPVIIAASACYPILTIMLSLRAFKEKIKFVPLVGAVVGIIGVVLLSLG